MNISDKDEIIKRMMQGSDTIRINRNKMMKVFRKRNKDGRMSKGYKKRLGKHMKLVDKATKEKEQE